ncbi:MAG TPA: ankyrin repeat domain-containing protein [Thermoanaerobaculia bacterium]|nr:ankyrin repeat domain-containing protein [Thermoanaerobaculia bacterium]
MSEFLQAVKSGDLVLIGRLLDSNSTLLGESENGVSCVRLALYHGKPEVARLLIERGAPLSFHDACAAGVNDRARQMLADDPSLLDQFSNDGYPPLGLAIFFGNRELAKVLIEKGADVNASATNAQRVAPLHAAAAVCDHEIIRLLLERGADPNARQQNDFTPLHTAASRGDVAMAELLLAHGAKRDARNADGAGVADIARQKGKDEFAEWWEKES